MIDEPTAPPAEEHEDAPTAAPEPVFEPLVVRAELWNINVRTQANAEAAPHHRVIAPGTMVGDIWTPTDINGEPQAVQDMAADLWTPENVEACRALAEEHYARFLPPPPSTDPIDWPLSKARLITALRLMDIIVSPSVDEVYEAIETVFADDPDMLAQAVGRWLGLTEARRDNYLFTALQPHFLALGKPVSDAQIDAAWMQAKDAH